MVWHRPAGDAMRRVNAGGGSRRTSVERGEITRLRAVEAFPVFAFAFANTSVRTTVVLLRSAVAAGTPRTYDGSSGCRVPSSISDRAILTPQFGQNLAPSGRGEPQAMQK